MNQLEGMGLFFRKEKLLPEPNYPKVEIQNLKSRTKYQTQIFK